MISNVAVKMRTCTKNFRFFIQSVIFRKKKFVEVMIFVVKTKQKNTLIFCIILWCFIYNTRYVFLFIDFI